MAEVHSDMDYADRIRKYTGIEDETIVEAWNLYLDGLSLGTDGMSKRKLDIARRKFYRYIGENDLRLYDKEELGEHKLAIAPEGEEADYTIDRADLMSVIEGRRCEVIGDTLIIGPSARPLEASAPPRSELDKAVVRLLKERFPQDRPKEWKKCVLKLWGDFAGLYRFLRELEGKPDHWAASAYYVFMRMLRERVSQKDAAMLFGSSTYNVSKRYRAIASTLDLAPFDSRYKPVGREGYSTVLGKLNTQLDELLEKVRTVLDIPPVALVKPSEPSLGHKFMPLLLDFARASTLDGERHRASRDFPLEDWGAKMMLPWFSLIWKRSGRQPVIERFLDATDVPRVAKENILRWGNESKMSIFLVNDIVGEGTTQVVDMLDDELEKYYVRDFHLSTEDFLGKEIFGIISPWNDHYLLVPPSFEVPFTFVRARRWCADGDEAMLEQISDPSNPLTEFVRFINMLECELSGAKPLRRVLFPEEAAQWIYWAVKKDDEAQDLLSSLLPILRSEFVAHDLPPVVSLEELLSIYNAPLGCDLLEPLKGMRKNQDEKDYFYCAALLGMFVKALSIKEKKDAGECIGEAKRMLIHARWQKHAAILKGYMERYGRARRHRREQAGTGNKGDSGKLDEGKLDEGKLDKR